MHGLIFELSVWLLAGSTRYQLKFVQRQTFNLHPKNKVFSDAKHFYSKAKMLENRVSAKFSAIKPEAHTNKMCASRKAAFTKTEFDKCIRNLVLLAKIKFSKRKQKLFASKKATKPTRKRLWTVNGHGSVLLRTSNHHRHSIVRF